MFKIKELKKRKLKPFKIKYKIQKKEVLDIDALLRNLNLKNGMTISFHHHLRNGDYIMEEVLKRIYGLGYKNITLFASAIFPCHNFLVELIKKKAIKNIYSAYISGEVGEAISNGLLEGECIMHSHGGRASLVMDKIVEIDFAFIASPTCDKFGNISGKYGKSACGSIGYAFTDAYFAKTSIAITDNLIDNLEDISISGEYIDYIVQIDKIGDSSKIVSGTTKITTNPIGLLIARNAINAITNSKYFKDNLSFQTGAGGVSLAVANYLKDEMIKHNIKGSFAAGGITKYLVEMYEENLFKELWDVQCFDLGAIKSIQKNKKHNEMSASKYANIYDDAIIDKLDIVILGATEIDTSFNVNVTTSSTGVIIGGSGGHNDTAKGAKMTIVVSQLVNSRISAVKDKVTTITTPGDTIDLFICEYGISVNPKRKDLIKEYKEKNIKIISIEELRKIALNLTKEPKPIEYTNEVVAKIMYRDNQIIDKIYKKKI